MRISSHASSNIFFVSGSGNVGIGTVTPTNRLEVIGVSGSSGIISPLYLRGWNATTSIGGTETSYGGLHLSNNLDTTAVLRLLGSGHIQLATDSSGRFISFATDAFVERMRITSGGEVGIGVTPTTGNRFWVRGSSTSSSDTSLFVQNSSPSSLFAVRNDGAVTTPLQPFAMGGLDGNQSISLNTFTTLNFSTSVGMFYYANVGSCWNNSTRAFTAPVTGTYLVNVSVLTNSIGQVAFHVNGNRKHSIPSGPFTGSVTWGGSAMIPLSSGEVLTLQGYGNAGTVEQNTFHTFFAIYLLG
jgi:hypothetical protein